ncbi:MAG TPA: sigma factor-like helix-turn-helix DNA-binding protein [Bacteriovoracaceae bacterium]|nr:sigma factor-like helix-turn-helix DNA-binding protein [Bacteriovoracaceae bacterium]
MEKSSTMRRKEFYQLASPLTEKLYQLAYSLVPDDLQAEQLVIDSVNAYLLKEKKWIHNKHVDLLQKKEVGILRKMIFKSLIRYLGDLGVRRSGQLGEQSLRVSGPVEFSQFFSLDPKIRLVIRLRYDNHFTVDEIGDIFNMPRYEVIEKIHNGRFLLLNDLNKGEEI